MEERKRGRRGVLRTMIKRPRRTTKEVAARKCLSLIISKMNLTCVKKARLIKKLGVIDTVSANEISKILIEIFST